MNQKAISSLFQWGALVSLSSSFADDPPELRRFHDAIIEGGSDFAPRLVLADWLGEHGRSQEAELLRLQTELEATCCEPDQHPERMAQQARLVELLAVGVRPCLPRRTVALAGSVEMTFAWIPPGTFRMGSPPDEAEREDDETQHRVTLTEGFYLGIHPVTQAQWQAVMDNNPSCFHGENLPVETVSWDDCQNFCKKLGQRSGQRYRLPTEAEWEYACRAGMTTRFHFGETIDTDQANYDGSFSYSESKKGIYRGQTTPIGSFPPNGWGLFDMHGNVLEWCADWFDAEYYKRSPRQDPQGPERGQHRVLRGGHWGIIGGRSCRAAARLYNSSDEDTTACGFRVVLVVGAKT